LRPPATRQQPRLRGSECRQTGSRRVDQRWTSIGHTRFVPLDAVWSLPKSATLLLIRHAEKSGDPADSGLTAAGRARAHAFVAYFQDLRRDADAIPAPAFLIAAADSKNSVRSRLTLTPLSQALALPIDASIADAGYPELARRLLDDHRYDGCTTLVCWHHGQILALARALGVPAQSLPSQWPDAEFAWLLMLDYDETGRLAHTQLRGQELMFGDRNPVNG